MVDLKKASPSESVHYRLLPALPAVLRVCCLLYIYVCVCGVCVCEYADYEFEEGVLTVVF